MEVQNTAEPIVMTIANGNMLSLSNNLVPLAVKQSIYDGFVLKIVPEKLESLLPEEFKSNEVSMEKATSIPLDVFQAKKNYKQGKFLKNSLKKLSQSSSLKKSSKHSKAGFSAHNLKICNLLNHRMQLDGYTIEMISLRKLYKI